MLLEVLKYDSEGNYIEPVMIEVDEDGMYELPERCTDKPLPQPNWKPKFDFGLNDWVETLSVNEIAILTGNSLEDVKKNRYIVLDSACENTILGRFSTTVDGEIYEFSYDAQAQSRFSGVATSFTRGYITEMEWTCYKNGERTSMLLTEEQFDVVAKDALFHEMSNIAKFREKLAELNDATTVEQVNSIEW